MAANPRVRATIAAHFDAVAAADGVAVGHCYALDATVADPVGSEPIRGRAAITAWFDTELTEPRDLQLVFVAVNDDHAAIHFRATPAGGPTRDVIDTMTFDEDGLISSMEVHADRQPQPKGCS